MKKQLSKMIQHIMPSLLLLSCITDDTFELPNPILKEPTIFVNSSIEKIKAALQQEFNNQNQTTYTFPVHENNPVFIEGYVISSDATGNFYKKIILQNSYINPTAGIEILINKSSLHEQYEIGRKVYVKLDGLTVSYNDGNSSIDPTNTTPGKYSLGLLVDNSLENIPSTMMSQHFFTSVEVEEIIPTLVTVSSIQENHINTFVVFDSIQFEKNQLGKSFAGEPHDEFDGFRYLFDCSVQKSIRLQTSTFSSFKSTVIPQGKGTINVVLSKDYTAKNLVALINTPSDIFFKNSDRCDPVFLDCDEVITQGEQVLFNEDFESIKNNSELTAAGWININLNNGSTLFKSRSLEGNRFLDISAYNSGENPMEVWLISPSIALDDSSNEVLTFETNTGYDNGKVVTVYVSTNYINDIKTATWIPVDALLSEGPSSGYGNAFTKSGTIPISCLQGQFRLAFKYEGADGGITTTFRIDNVKITGMK